MDVLLLIAARVYAYVFSRTEPKNADIMSAAEEATTPRISMLDRCLEIIKCINFTGGIVHTMSYSYGYNFNGVNYQLNANAVPNNLKLTLNHNYIIRR